MGMGENARLDRSGCGGEEDTEQTAMSHSWISLFTTHWTDSGAPPPPPSLCRHKTVKEFVSCHDPQDILTLPLSNK